MCVHTHIYIYIYIYTSYVASPRKTWRGARSDWARRRRPKSRRVYRSFHILPFQPILFNRYLPSEPVKTAKNSPPSISEGGRLWQVCVRYGCWLYVVRAMELYSEVHPQLYRLHYSLERQLQRESSWRTDFGTRGLRVESNSISVLAVVTNKVETPILETVLFLILETGHKQSSHKQSNKYELFCSAD